MNGKLCEKLSCNKTKMAGVCKDTDAAGYHYVGDDAYDVHCQPACFNTKIRPTYANTERLADTPQLTWFNGGCKIIPDEVVTYLEKPFYRDQTRYVRRVNDMPTGFSRMADGDPDGIGFTYRNNRRYCAYYDRTLTDDGDCSYEWWEEGLDAVLGMSLINTVKDGVRCKARRPEKYRIPLYGYRRH